MELTIYINDQTSSIQRDTGLHILQGMDAHNSVQIETTVIDNVLDFLL